MMSSPDAALPTSPIWTNVQCYSIVSMKCPQTSSSYEILRAVYSCFKWGKKLKAMSLEKVSKAILAACPRQGGPLSWQTGPNSLILLWTECNKERHSLSRTPGGI